MQVDLGYEFGLDEERVLVEPRAVPALSPSPTVNVICQEMFNGSLPVELSLRVKDPERTNVTMPNEVRRAMAWLDWVRGGIFDDIRRAHESDGWTMNAGWPLPCSGSGSRFIAECKAAFANVDVSRKPEYQPDYWRPEKWGPWTIRYNCKTLTGSETRALRALFKASVAMEQLRDGVLYGNDGLIEEAVRVASLTTAAARERTTWKSSSFHVVYGIHHATSRHFSRSR